MHTLFQVIGYQGKRGSLLRSVDIFSLPKYRSDLSQQEITAKNLQESDFLLQHSKVNLSHTIALDCHAREMNKIAACPERNT